MKLTSIDAFTKVDDSFLHRSTSGGWLTIFIFCIMGYLTLTELLHYSTLQQHHEFIVDPTINQAVTLTIDLTIAMPCKYLSIDSFDTSGASQNVEKKFQKETTTFSVGKASLHGYNEKLQKRHDVNILDLFSGLLPEIEVDDASDNEHDACRVKGKINLTKVSGSVHITSLGHAYFGIHTPHKKINFTHRVDKLSFGEDTPRSLQLPQPLSNSYELSTTNFEMYQYFISVIPTTYYQSGARILDTYQYAVTDQKIVLATQEDYGAPGIFFRYSFEPLAVSIFETYPESFLRFIVRLCGIVGGVYVCAGILHHLSRWFYNLWTRGIKAKEYYVRV